MTASSSATSLEKRKNLQGRIQEARLYGILDLGYLDAKDPYETAASMAKGGVDVIQLRGKHEAASKLLEIAKKIRPLLKDKGILFFINDHGEVARGSQADGLHVGQDDMPISEARKLLLPGQLVGKSTHSLEQALAAEKEGADYIGVGPIFATPTKPDYVPVGLELISKVGSSVTVPQFGIGGIKLENLSQVVAGGAKRVVIVSGILNAPDIVSYCQKVRTVLAQYPTP